MLNNKSMPAKGGSQPKADQPLAGAKTSGGKLLIITRKVVSNDALAGFAYNWVRKIAVSVDKLKVICWQQGEKEGLPANVEIFSLANKPRWFKPFILFFLAFKELKDVDGLFCHMNPEYTIIAGLAAKLRRKKIVSWYTHKQINWKRRLLEILANQILTASPESFRQPWFKNKVMVTGHGIDIENFHPVVKNNLHGVFHILTIGRISPTKDYESMVKAVDFLVKAGIKNIKLDIIGKVGLPSDQNYQENLKAMVKKIGLEDKVKFLGAAPNIEIPKYLTWSDLFINLSETGSVDKAVLEAMACECLVLTSNEAFKDILPSELMVGKNNPQKLAEKIKWLMDLSEEEKNKLRRHLREIVVKNHNLDNLVLKIIKQF